VPIAHDIQHHSRLSQVTSFRGQHTIIYFALNAPCTTTVRYIAQLAKYSKLLAENREFLYILLNLHCADLRQFWTESLQNWQQYGGIIADKQGYFELATSLCIRDRQRHF